MNFYTIEDVRWQVEQLDEFLRSAPEVAEFWGMSDWSELSLSEGSPSAGRAFRLHYTNGQNGAHRTIGASVTSPSYLGMTKAQAVDALMALRREGYLVERLVRPNESIGQSA